MQGPLVSIAMVVYNQETFIAEALESCLAQTYEPIEICVSDDCSTDTTADIVREYADKYPNRIRLHVQTQNLGQYTIAANFNSVLDMCGGEFVTLFHGDDVMLPERIERQVAFLQKHPDCIAVSHRCEVFDTEEGRIEDTFFASLDYEDRSPSCLIRNGNQVPTPTIMFRREETKDLRFNASIRRMPDWYFFIEMAMHGRIAHQDAEWTRYRRHRRCVTNDIKDMMRDTFVTLALVEINYPEYAYDVQLMRAFRYWKMRHEDPAYRRAWWLTFGVAIWYHKFLGMLQRTKRSALKRLPNRDSRGLPRKDAENAKGLTQSRQVVKPARVPREQRRGPQM